MGLLDATFVTSVLTADDPFCRGHGSQNGSEYLGAGLLYYALAYSMKSRVCVCLGSGGGFVPRMMRQAQRDLRLEGARTILVDGLNEVPKEKVAIWGTPYWAPADSTFRPCGDRSRAHPVAACSCCFLSVSAISARRAS
jgi:hypothetical protein